MALITISEFSYPGGWQSDVDKSALASEYCRKLEEGNILMFPQPPFEFPKENIEFLLKQKQSDFEAHKNISYRPKGDILRGAEMNDKNSYVRFHEVMRDFSKNLIAAMQDFLIPYSEKWILDFASYRPLEEKGRDIAHKRRNDLVHVDSFPSRPSMGGRILRVFVNINPDADRKWRVSGDFKAIAEKYADDCGLRKLTGEEFELKYLYKRQLSKLKKIVRAEPLKRTTYDQFMLEFHDYLKSSEDFQKNFPMDQHSFPPLSCWMVYTDGVAHGVLEGQYALEQTFMIPPNALVAPEASPLQILQKMSQKPLVPA